MKEKKTIIDLQGVIAKENGKEFTGQEHEQLYYGFIDFIESKKCMFGGGSELMTEKEYISK